MIKRWLPPLIRRHILIAGVHSGSNRQFNQVSMVKLLRSNRVTGSIALNFSLPFPPCGNYRPNYSLETQQNHSISGSLTPTHLSKVALQLGGISNALTVSPQLFSLRHNKSSIQRLCNTDDLVWVSLAFGPCCNHSAFSSRRPKVWWEWKITAQQSIPYRNIQQDRDQITQLVHS